VLFIDEAYQLDPTRGHTFGGEALDEIVKNMTLERFKGKLAIVLSGYEKEIDHLLSANTGLRSRFTERIRFKDLTPPAVAELLQIKLQDKELSISPDVSAKLPSICERLVSVQDFGNGRDVETWAAKINTICAVSNVFVVDEPCIELALEELLATKSRRPEEPERSPAQVFPGPPVAHMYAPMAMPPPMQPAIDLAPPTVAVAVTEAAPPPPPPPPAAAAEPEVLAAAPPEAADPQPPKDAEPNPFEHLDPHFLKSLQTVLDEKGLNSAAGAARLAELTGDKLDHLANKLAKLTGMSPQAAQQFLRDWKGAYKSLQEIKAKALVHCKAKKQVW
jgi:hypothetical protein